MEHLRPELVKARLDALRAESRAASALEVGRVRPAWRRRLAATLLALACRLDAAALEAGRGARVERGTA